MYYNNLYENIVDPEFFKNSGVVIGTLINFDKPIWGRHENVFEVIGHKNITGRIINIISDNNYPNNEFKKVVTILDINTGRFVKITVKNLIRTITVITNKHGETTVNNNPKKIDIFKKSIKDRAKKINDKKATERYIDF